MKYRPLLPAVLLFFVCLSACSSQGHEVRLTPAVPAEVGRAWPGRDWQTAAPEEQGLDPNLLGQILPAIEEQQISLHSLLVIRHGYVVFEAYFDPYKADARHELYSVTKSFTSALVGIAVDQGAIQNLDQTVLGFFPEQSFANIDARKEVMTVRHLLTMTSGLDWLEGDATYRAMYFSRDWAGYVFDLPMLEDPGTRFEYCSGCSHLLSAILNETTGTNVLAFAEKNLFRPIGIRDVEWETDAQGIPIGGWGLQLTPREMARLGYLYLNGGRWNGQQVVPTEWVEDSAHAQVETGGDLAYGYQWWIYPSHGGYAALGRAGQTILVFPDLDLVIVTTANIADHEPIFELVDEYILPAVDMH